MPGECEQVRIVEGQIKGSYEVERYKLITGVTRDRKRYMNVT